MRNAQRQPLVRDFASTRQEAHSSVGRHYPPVRGGVVASRGQDAQRQPLAGIAVIASEMKAGCVGRRDLPEVHFTRRGSRASLLEAASSPSHRERAVRTLRSRFFAKTTVGPKRSRLRTAEHVAKRQGIIHIYPMQASDLESVAASFVHAGYRSTPKYLTELKMRNLELGHPWPAQLDLIMRRCCVAASRGIGPPRKAGEIRLAVAATMPDAQAPVACNGPEFPKRSWLVAVFWMLREIELAGIKLHSSHIELGESLGRLTLPVSKQDPGAVGRTRVFHCICKLGSVPDGWVPGRSVCPVCALKRQVAHRCAQAGVTQTDEKAKKIPLFCTSAGEIVGKTGVVSSWRALLRAAIGPADRPGVDDVSGHSARRSGAKTLCRCGWELWKIQFHARHASDAIKGYTEEAFAENAALWTIGPAVAAQPCAERAPMPELAHIYDRVEEANSQGLRLEEAVARTAAELKTRSCELAAIVDSVARELDGRTRYVRNTAGDCLVHIMAHGGLEAPAAAWRTHCGWVPLEGGRFMLRFAPPSDASKRCKRCFGHEYATTTAPSGV